jgi:hypothetical protein
MHAWEGCRGIFDGDQICSQHSVFRPKGSHPSLSSRCGTQSCRRGNTHGSCRISVSVFVCARAFAEDLPSEIHRALAPAPHAITSLHAATSSMDPPLFDGGTEVDSGPDGNRTIAGPFGAKHAPVARYYHLGRVVDLFVQ